ncbi:nucleoside-diphosphate sugar epimerase/dehydratase [Marinobacter mangrovi]|uniref:nucleoside-diphosphate sugar epimerase/dehydratase n=1 Tax=Marinobacter mangrovi TaxID=2803918 RepID=UPI0019319E4C|nr:hypothetical protein [Marinobacter mangrovi]
MTPWRSRLKRWFGGQKPPANLIIVGVGYPGFSLGQAVQASGRFQLVAFIDDEPWNNRTRLLGATVQYPGELAALIQRHQVKVVVRIEGEPPVIADNIWEEVMATGVRTLTLRADSDTETRLSELRGIQD